MQQNNKRKGNLRTGLIIAVGALAFIFVVLIIYKKKQVAPPVTNPVPELPVTQENNGIVPLTEEKKAEIEAIRNIKGKITAIDTDSIEVVLTEGEKITLKIPQEGANFSSLTKQDDGSFMVKAISLSEISKDKEVDIKYNITTNEVLLVSVK